MPQKNTLRGASVAGWPKASRGAERSEIPSGKKASPFYPTSQRISPYSALAAVPKTMTGPAMTNIYAAVPVTIPSARKSMAGETTSVPAPPKRASLL